jgi:serine protease Do
MLVASQLIESGRVTRAYLGVHLDVRFTEDMARRLGLPRQQGAYVTGVTPESPAEAAQIRTGDVILRFDGFPIDDDNHLITRVGLTPVGEKVDVVVWRDRTEHKVRVQVGDRSRFERER